MRPDAGCRVAVRMVIEKDRGNDEDCLIDKCWVQKKKVTGKKVMGGGRGAERLIELGCT